MSSNDFLLDVTIEQVTTWSVSFDRAPELTD